MLLHKSKKKNKHENCSLHRRQLCLPMHRPQFTQLEKLTAKNLNIPILFFFFHCFIVIKKLLFLKFHKWQSQRLFQTLLKRRGSESTACKSDSSFCDTFAVQTFSFIMLFVCLNRNSVSHLNYCFKFFFLLSWVAEM